jgi:hypothetical protein
MSPRSSRSPDRFDFETFIAAVIDLDFELMFAAIDCECDRVERAMQRKGGLQARADGGEEYVSKLKQVTTSFHTGLIPPGSPPPVRAACRRIGEQLVGKGLLEAAVLAPLVWPTYEGALVGAVGKASPPFAMS